METTQPNQPNKETIETNNLEGLKLGATGNFPDGKLKDDDEGEIRIGVTVDEGNVIIAFGTALKWVAFPPDVAIALAETLIKNANKILTTPPQQPTAQ
jgi:hypothetical protein